MKYILIFCLLFVITNSKQEFKRKSSLLKGLIANDYNPTLKSSECDANTKDKCKALPSPEDDMICCFYE